MHIILELQKPEANRKKEMKGKTFTSTNVFGDFSSPISVIEQVGRKLVRYRRFEICKTVHPTAEYFLCRCTWNSHTGRLHVSNNFQEISKD